MLIRTYGAGRIAPFSLLVPIFGMSSSALFLGETFGPLRMAAAALVLAGLMLTLVRKRAPLARCVRPEGILRAHGRQFQPEADEHRARQRFQPALHAGAAAERFEA